MNELQLHRGATEGFRNKPENISRICENITRTRYSHNYKRGPISYSPSKKNWELPWRLKRRFLDTNYRFTSDGRRIQVI